MKKLRTFVIFCLAALLLGGIGVYAATNYGSESDPLITLSYLNQVLKPELEQKYTQQTEETLSALESRVGSEANGGYKSVTVAANQTMTCQAGCEFLVRSGSAYVSEGFLDVTEGKETAKNDWLQAHHLYMAVSDNAAVTATGSTVVMVRGAYTIS